MKERENNEDFALFMANKYLDDPIAFKIALKLF